MYSDVMKRMIGEVRKSLESQGFRRQSRRFSTHGVHAAAADAPLILVACSGGRDSLALAYVASIVCPMLGLRCGAVLVNHNLQEGSEQVSRHAAKQCVDMGLEPVHTQSIHVIRSKAGEEADARNARYEAITAYATQVDAAAVLLAHTLDDQAETVLMGLLRGAGVHALAGMPATIIRDGVRCMRPLLAMRRADTTKVCEDAHLHWWDDPSNGDNYAMGHHLPTHYPLRSRIRHDVMPLLDSFTETDAATLLAGNAASAREDIECLDTQAQTIASAIITADGDPLHHASSDPDDALSTSAVVTSFDADRLKHYPAALRKRVIMIALNRIDIPFSHRHVIAIDDLVMRWHGQGAVNLPLQYSANRKNNVIHVCKDGGHANR